MITFERREELRLKAEAAQTCPDDTDKVAQFRADVTSDVVLSLLGHIAQMEAIDSQAATYVESVICMRTDFTGDAPNTGWKGIGMALGEALDERDVLRDRLAAIRAAAANIHWCDDRDFHHDVLRAALTESSGQKTV